jgi:hypothetical protein
VNRASSLAHGKWRVGLHRRVEFVRAVGQFNWQPAKTLVHMHHTWQPNHSQYHGLSSIPAIYDYHVHTNGWSDIAAHFDRARRKGLEWPAMEQVAGKRGRLNSSRAFMFEIIGDFDIGKDRLTGPQSDTVVLVIATLMSHDLGNGALKFHMRRRPRRAARAVLSISRTSSTGLLPYSHMSESDARAAVRRAPQGNLHCRR